MTDVIPSSSETASALANRTATIKVNEIDEQTLEAIAAQSNNVNMQAVRPWIEGDYARSVIDAISQFAFYKCMHEDCIYATNSMENWFVHMKMHLQVLDYFQKHNALRKCHREKIIKFRECPYCGYEAKTNQDIIIHMEEEHRRAIFQCSLCFYRTIEIDNLILHMNSYHTASGRKDIYVCGDQRQFEQQDEDILEQDIESNVAKIVCGQGKKCR